MAEVDVAVVGGGAIGLAIAAAVQQATVVVCERHRRFGAETSTHNSGVIHAGLYYPAGSLKAALCVEGRERLYEYCTRRGVAHARCGKLLVAAMSDDVPRLEALAARAAGNCVDDLRWMGPAEISAREPHVHAAAALLSPSSGIVSAEELVRALADDCQERDVALLPATRIIEASSRADRLELVTPRERFSARVVVNAAGLYADEVSAMFGGERFHIYPCRGEYAELAPNWRGRFRGPVYPLPDPSGHGLGVHITPTTWGSILLGPTIRYQPRKDDYESDRLPLEKFLAPARTLVPRVTMSDLRPGGTGIRAKLHPPEASFADFLIRPDAFQPALIHAAGIDSPGLTACLAIGARVAGLISERL